MCALYLIVDNQWLLKINITFYLSVAHFCHWPCMLVYVTNKIKSWVSWAPCWKSPIWTSTVFYSDVIAHQRWDADCQSPGLSAALPGDSHSPSWSSTILLFDSVEEGLGGWHQSMPSLSGRGGERKRARVWRRHDDALYRWAPTFLCRRSWGLTGPCFQSTVAYLPWSNCWFHSPLSNHTGSEKSPRKNNPGHLDMTFNTSNTQMFSRAVWMGFFFFFFKWKYTRLTEHLFQLLR